MPEAVGDALVNEGWELEPDERAFPPSMAAETLAVVAVGGYPIMVEVRVPWTTVIVTVVVDVCVVVVSSAAAKGARRQSAPAMM